MDLKDHLVPTPCHVLRQVEPCRSDIPRFVCPPGDRQEADQNHSTSSSDGKKKKTNSTAKPRIKHIDRLLYSCFLPLWASHTVKKSSSLYYFFLFFFFPKIASLSLSITEQKRQSKIKALLLLLGDKPMFLDCCIVTVQTV